MNTNRVTERERESERVFESRQAQGREEILINHHFSLFLGEKGEKKRRNKTPEGKWDYDSPYFILILLFRCRFLIQNIIVRSYKLTIGAIGKYKE